MSQKHNLGDYRQIMNSRSIIAITQQPPEKINYVFSNASSQDQTPSETLQVPNLATALKIRGYNGPVRIFTMIVEPDLVSSNGHLPHGLQFRPKSIDDLKTIDEYGQLRNVIEGETVSVIIREYPNGQQIDYIASNLEVVKFDNTNDKLTSLKKNLITFMRITNKSPSTILSEHGHKWSNICLTAGNVFQQSVDHIAHNHLKHLDHDRARLMYFVELQSTNPQPNMIRYLSGEFLDGTLQWVIKHVTPNEGLSNTQTPVMVTFSERFNADINPMVIIKDTNGKELHKIDFKDIEIIDKYHIKFEMPSFHNMYEPKQVQLIIQSATNSSLKSNCLRFMYYQDEDIKFPLDTIKNYEIYPQIGERLGDFRFSYHAQSSAFDAPEKDYGKSSADFIKSSNNDSVQSVEQGIQKMSFKQQFDSVYDSGIASMSGTTSSMSKGSDVKLQDKDSLLGSTTDNLTEAETGTSGGSAVMSEDKSSTSNIKSRHRTSSEAINRPMHTIKDQLHQAKLREKKLHHRNIAMLFHFAEHNDMKSVIKLNLPYCSVQNRSGNTPLHSAIIHQQDDIASTLIANMKIRPNLFNIQNNENKTPLHLAVKNNKADLVDKLMKGKACSAIADRNRETPLHIACRLGHIECVRNLLQEIKNERQIFTFLHQDYEEFNIGGNTPLHLAIKSGRNDLIELFRNYRLRLDIKERVFNNSPLHIAIMCNELAIAESLIKYGADVNAVNSYGNTPLHAAAHLNLKEMIILLTNNGADVSAKNYEQQEPVNYLPHDCDVELRNLLTRKDLEIL